MCRMQRRISPADRSGAAPMLVYSRLFLFPAGLLLIALALAAPALG